MQKLCPKCGVAFDCAAPEPGCWCESLATWQGARQEKADCLARLVGIEPTAHHTVEQLYHTKWSKLLKPTTCTVGDPEALTFRLAPE